MKIRSCLAAAALGITSGLFNCAAIAQTQPPAQNPAPPAEAPSQPELLQRPRMGRDGGMMMGRGGFGPGAGPRMQGLSDADRTAFFEARLAAVKAGLMLNEAQQSLWPAVEAAIRDMMKLRQDFAERLRKEGRPANPVDRMKRAGEMMSARGAAVTKMAEAMKPFHDSLSDDQKRRMQMLMRPMSQRMGQQRGPGFSPGPRGEFRQRWQEHGGGNFGQGEGRRWRQDAPGQGLGSGDDRRGWRRM